MTANRWWVKLAARWLARVGGVEGHLRLAMLGLTGVSTASLTLRQYGHGELAWPLIAAVLAGTLVYTYLYTEGGVWNQVQRDKRDLSNNFAGPNARISNELLVRGLVAAEQGEPLDDEQVAVIRDELDTAFVDLRGGVVLDRGERL